MTAASVAGKRAARPEPADADGPLPEALRRLMGEAVAARPWAGLAVGVVDRRRPDGILWLGGHLGHGGAAPTPETLFDLASITKTFTATLLELWAARRPELVDARLGDVLPAGMAAPADALARVPWRSIPAFLSGLPSDNLDTGPVPDYKRFALRDYGLDALFRHAAAPGFPVDAPGVAYTYSSLGFALLAECLTAAVGDGAAFPDVLRASLLDPLGMAGTRCLDDAARRLLPPCFDAAGGPAEPGVGGGFPAHFGSAGVLTTPADMLRWLRFQMGYLPGHELSTLLPNLQLPVTDLRTPAGLRAGRGFFLKDMDTARGPRQVVLKSGGIGSFVAWISFVASPRPGLMPSPVGLFALSSGAFDIRAFGMDALRLLVEADVPHRPRRPGLRTRDPRTGEDGPRVSYGLPVLASAAGHAAGGIVKFQPLAQQLPNHTADFDVLCLVSSRLPADAVDQARAARAAGAKLLYNQAGSACPATHGRRWRELNRPLEELLHMADVVVYQSKLAVRLADRYLGVRQGPWSLLPNAVDTRRFRPATEDPSPDRELVLLGGTQYRRYRLETALHAFAILRRRRPRAHLLVSGQLVWIPDQVAARRLADGWIRDLGLSGHVTFLGSYTQDHAPEIFRRAHVLLHPMFLDCCPTVVLEAMASGLPVVYGAGGGVEELVGDEAGLGVPTVGDFESHRPPEPRDLADALDRALAARHALGAAGRARAVERFDLQPWLRRYRELIYELAGRPVPMETEPCS